MSLEAHSDPETAELSHNECWRCQPATMTVRQTVYELLNSFSHSAIRRSFGWRHLTSITLPNAPQTAHHHVLRFRTAMASLHHRVATSVRGATDGTGT